jgi:hypothetical protein
MQSWRVAFDISHAISTTFRDLGQRPDTGVGDIIHLGMLWQYYQNSRFEPEIATSVTSFQSL